MSYKKFIDDRMWLNDTTSSDSGALHCQVSADTNDFEYSYVDATLSIWDCSRKIVLSFDFETKEQAKERAIKVDKFIKVLMEMREAMGEAYEAMNYE